MQINSTEDLHDLLTVIMDTAKDLLNCEGSSLLLYDLQENSLIFDIVRGSKGNLLANQKIPLGQGIAGIVAETREPLVVHDAQNDERVLKSFDKKIRFQTRNILAVPLLAREKLVGVLELVNTRDKRDFSEEDLQLLSYLSNQAAIAINNRQLFTDLHIRMEELKCIYEISQTISTNVDFARNADNIVEAIQRTLGVNRVSLILKQTNSNSLFIQSHVGLLGIEHTSVSENTESISRHVLSTGDPLIVQDIEKDPALYRLSSSGNYKSKSFISLPIIYENRTLGVLNVSDKENNEVFDLFDYRVLSTIASQLADAYVSYTLYEDNMSMQQMKKDLAMASLIQKNSLPQLPSELLGLEIAYYYEACEAVGGDFYDVSLMGDNLITFVIGDVSGKGVSAALFMEHVKTLLQGYIPRFKNPRTSVSELNRKILQESRSSLFVTCMVIQVELESKQLRYASAGHNHQLLLRRRDAIIELLSGKGPPAGTFKIDKFTEEVTPYEKGDVLFLYTDGVTEATNADLLQYGEQRLLQLLQGTLNSGKEFSAQDYIDLVLNDMQQFTGNFAIADDLTILTVKLI